MSKEKIPLEPGRRIRRLREKLDLTRLQFRQQTGMSDSTLRALEVGEAKLTDEKALTLSHLFILLFGLDEEEASQEALLYGTHKGKKTEQL